MSLRKKERKEENYNDKNSLRNDVKFCGAYKETTKFSISNFLGVSKEPSKKWEEKKSKVKLKREKLLKDTLVRELSAEAVAKEHGVTPSQIQYYA